MKVRIEHIVAVWMRNMWKAIFTRLEIDCIKTVKLKEKIVLQQNSV